MLAELVGHFDYDLASCLSLRHSRPKLPTAAPVSSQAEQQQVSMSSSGFVGGKLKLKGGDPLKGGVKKKKKKPVSTELALTTTEEPTGEEKDKVAEPVKTKDGFVLPDPPKNADRRTEAEKRHAERLKKLEEERLRKQAAKGYRDRVKDFNEHLASLSEHHDIPKVGPG